jgi:hypothetical protein
MPRFLMRLLWAVRGKRLVRLHLAENKPSVEGVLAGRWGGHYVVLAPKILDAHDRSFSLDGHLEVPAERVLYVQVID